MISAPEPGGATEIAETAQHQYGVAFPMAAKAIVKGPNAHPFYKWAAEARPGMHADSTNTSLAATAIMPTYSLNPLNQRIPRKTAMPRP